MGVEHISSEVEKFHLNDEPDLRGLAGPYIKGIFREAPGGELAARRCLAKCLNNDCWLWGQNLKLH